MFQNFLNKFLISALTAQALRQLQRQKHQSVRVYPRAVVQVDLRPEVPRCVQVGRYRFQDARGENSKAQKKRKLNGVLINCSCLCSALKGFVVDY